MQELVGKLSALDPEASDALKVVAYFDALISNRVGPAGLLRGAAVLSGAVIGLDRHGSIMRCDPQGVRMPEQPQPDGVMNAATSGGVVWLERSGSPHANDRIILERLALGLQLLDSSGAESNSLAVAIDSGRPLEERVAALGRLKLEPHDSIRLVATAVESSPGPGPTVVMPTRYGMMRATIETGTTAGGRAGLGLRARADHAPDSWLGAVIALRLATDLTPVVDAADLGAMLLLATAYDPDAPHEDVRALASLDPRNAEILRVIVESDSIRSAATELGMHHSTVQAKHDSLTRALGYDVRTTSGRMRYIAAEMLRRVTEGV
ncbi:hypothetical protein ACFVAE_12290 [Microbacterium sp. NPDC057659]|uniref:hypothetical protein n=1 Tax=Microbacterium sp. NPDC057659 TaxID=3346198 RepID=UPI003670030D